MAPKGKKGKKLSPKEEASGANEWPDLPHQLLNLTGRLKHRSTQISWGGRGIGKSWRPVAEHCIRDGKMPRLQISSISDNTGDQKDLGKFQPHIKFIPFLPGFYAWITQRQTPESRLSYDPLATWSWWHMPDAYLPFKFATLMTDSRWPTICTIMVLTGISRPAFLTSRLEHSGSSPAWVEQDCLVDPYDSAKQPIIFTNAIGFKGKFYALSLQGALAVVEEVDSQFKITSFSKNRAVPSVSSRYFTEYLLESNGEILLVLLISRKSSNIINDVEVFQLERVRLLWVKMSSLGDIALFLGTNCCTSVTASQLGYKRNHVYFTHRAINSWQEFDMESGNISPCSNNMDSEIESGTG